MSSVLFSFFFLFSCSTSAYATSYYYWREYTFGDIPEDAAIGGQNEHGRNAYIVQFVQSRETMKAAQIFDGMSYLATPERRHQRNIKILCGSQESFLWVAYNTTNVNFKNKAVIGGHVKDEVVLIGRALYNGIFRIGSVFNGQFTWIDDDGHEHVENLYHILINEYREPPSIDIPPFPVAPLGYYWREYNGTIPRDALVGGTDINHRNIYIGQVLCGIHLLPARIVPNTTLVQVTTTTTVFSRNKYVKILCGSEFYWLSITGNTLLERIIDRETVLGGYSNHETPLRGPQSGYLAIGRVRLENDVKIGQIYYFVSRFLPLYFPNKGGTETSAAFQILTVR